MSSYQQRHYQKAAQALEDAYDAAQMNEMQLSLRMLDQALDLLEMLPPTRQRDILLARTHLGCYKALSALKKPQATQHLRRGVSYARTTYDAQVRQFAQQCLQEADVVI